jgi:4'-phosphopantetheinyl transferase
LIEVFASRIPENGNLSLFDDTIPLLSDEKREKIRRFIRIEDALRTLVGERMIRKIISERFGSSPYEILIGLDQYGKPHFRNRNDFYFNISHSGVWVVCAVGIKPVGVDVEQVVPVDLNVARNYFSPEEYMDLMGVDDGRKLDYFYELWTLKESFIKAVGKGLRIPLNSFSARIHNEEIELHPGRYQPEWNASEYKFKIFDFDQGYKLAACGFEDKFAEKVVFM